jgi:hypothetical protein
MTDMPATSAPPPTEPPAAAPPAVAAEPRESPRFYKTLISIFIAAVAVIGAWVTWRATVLAGDAGGANSSGLTSTLAAEQARTLDLTTFYRHYAAYTSYARSRALGDQLNGATNQIFNLSEGGSFDAHPKLKTYAAGLDNQRDSAYDQASAGQYFFPTRYLAQDGSYNKALELGEADARSARASAQDADQSFALADRLHDGSNQLVGVVIVLTLALLLFTLASVLNNVLQYVAGALGFVVMLAGVVAALIIGV